MDIILASTSPYRKQLLERLNIEFSCMAPEIDEETLKHKVLQDNSDPINLAVHLARAKALSVATSHPEAIVIGSDQLAHLDQQILGKPGSDDKAIQQLKLMSGKAHQLITAVTITYKDQIFEELDCTTLHMHEHDLATLERYVSKDQPIDCAGSYKLEASGIALFERIDSKDHSAITGLPLLFVTKVLRQLGVTVP